MSSAQPNYRPSETFHAVANRYEDEIQRDAARDFALPEQPSADPGHATDHFINHGRLFGRASLPTSIDDGESLGGLAPLPVMPDLPSALEVASLPDRMSVRVVGSPARHCGPEPTYMQECPVCREVAMSESKYPGPQLFDPVPGGGYVWHACRLKAVPMEPAPIPRRPGPEPTVQVDCPGCRRPVLVDRLPVGIDTMLYDRAAGGRGGHVEHSCRAEPVRVGKSHSDLSREELAGILMSVARDLVGLASGLRCGRDWGPGERQGLRSGATVLDVTATAGISGEGGHP